MHRVMSFSRIRPLNHVLNRHAGKILLAGLALVAAHNWRLWQNDRALAERLRAKQLALPQLTHTPRVSALVAGWNEAEHLAAHIESFLALDYPNSELILCAGGSDATLAIARRFASARVIVLEQRAGEGKQKALARCFAQASGQIIYLTDADCLFDDESFRLTIGPVVSGEEKVCTGGARPFRAALGKPFVVAQAVSDVRMYADDTAPAYLPGLLGRNCAIERDFLQRAGGFAAPAPTGTDYVLAHELVAAGARIRQVRISQVETEYPANARAYIRQRRRWLRNVAVHGLRYRARGDVYSSLTTSFAGMAMLALPFTSLRFGAAALSVWFPMLVGGWLARLRYLRFAHLVRGWPFSVRHSMALLLVLLLDFVAWAAPLLDYLQPASREKW